MDLDIGYDSNEDMIFKYDNIFDAVARFNELVDTNYQSVNKWRPMEEEKSPMTLG